MIPAKRGRKTNPARRAKSTAKIGKSALNLFVQKGFHSTTMDQIAANAKLTKGGVYFYVKSKEKLLLSLLDEIEQVYLIAPFEEIAASERSCRQKIIDLMNFQARYAADKGEHLMLLVMMSVEFSGKKSLLSQRIEGIYRRMHGFVKSQIEQGIAAGEFRAEVPSKEIASFYISTHDGMTLEWYRRKHEIDGKKLVSAYRRMFIMALEQMN